MSNILSRPMGISALKPIKKNIGNSRRNRRETEENYAKKNKM